MLNLSLLISSQSVGIEAIIARIDDAFSVVVDCYIRYNI